MVVMKKSMITPILVAGAITASCSSQESVPIDTPIRNDRAATEVLGNLSNLLLVRSAQEGAFRYSGSRVVPPLSSEKKAGRAWGNYNARFASATGTCVIQATARANNFYPPGGWVDGPAHPLPAVSTYSISASEGGSVVIASPPEGVGVENSKAMLTVTDPAHGGEPRTFVAAPEPGQEQLTTSAANDAYRVAQGLMDVCGIARPQ